ncbi:hypothetical protein [Priestia endophytica]|uniref:hypothetical protein n=1 Tax=Priestia endophytica TaxID=135735 RepID=UPI000DCA4E21|nr:hypothetical protein [Priestia endophytica]RAS86412.1 hypothetical protein A4U60_07920 [Priestia endophytica]
MSDCSKRKFKELDTRKKFRRNYINKEEKQLRYRDKKCKDDSWHDDKKDFCCDKKDDCKHKEKKETVVEFDVSQSTPTTGTLINGTSPTGLNPANTIILDQVKVHVKDEDNQVLIQGTVEWDPDDVSVLLALILAIIAVLTTGSVVFPLSVQATFRVWKSEDDKKHNGPILPIFETTDTASIGGIALPLAIVFGPTTTSFHFVDDKPSCGKNRYYLTMEVSTLASGSVPALAPLTGILDILESLFPGGVIPFTTDTHVLTAMEIASVDRD